LILFVVPQDDQDHRFIKAAYLIVQALQTILDVPFIVASAGILVLGPHRVKQTLRLYREKPADQWRVMILKQYVNVVVDIPFIAMLIILCLTVFMAIKLKKKVDLK
jgi:hypothetical protein